VGVLGLSLIMTQTALSFDVASAAALAEACRSFTLPDASVAGAASLTLGSSAVAVMMLACRSAIRQLRASRRFLRTLTISGRGPHDAVLFDDARPLAFCAGLLRPRIYLSTGAVLALNAGELDAVVAHEAHHARLRDLLRVLIARVFSEALFFLPAMRRLAQRYTALTELAADGAAVRARGAQSLASALLAFEAADPVVVGIAPERVDHLLGDRPAWELPRALIAWALVALTTVAVVAVRLEAAEGMSPLNVPMFVAGLCMVAMAVLPLVLGAVALLGGGRLLATRRAG